MSKMIKEVWVVTHSKGLFKPSFHYITQTKEGLSELLSSVRAAEGIIKENKTSDIEIEIHFESGASFFATKHSVSAEVNIGFDV